MTLKWYKDTTLVLTMTCQTSDAQHIVRGNLESIPFELYFDVMSITFTTSGVSTAPSIGDIYLYSANNTIDGYTVTSIQLVVTSIDGDDITFQSYLESNKDDYGNTIISSTGTLIQSTGGGDATLTYTGLSTDYYYDTAGRTVKLRILKNIVDSPDSEDIIITKNATITSKGIGVWEFSVAETSVMPVGNWFGVIEIYRNSTDVQEQTDNDVFPIVIDKNKV